MLAATGVITSKSKATGTRAQITANAEGSLRNARHDGAMRISKNGKWGVVAVVVVALVAAGAAIAATQFHSSPKATSSAPIRNGEGFLGRQGEGAPPQDGRGFRGRGGAFGGLSSAATYLGIDQSTLSQDLQNGKTLAQIAGATSGKSASGLIDAMVAAEQQQLDQAVKDGRITQSQADQMSTNIKSQVTAMVNGSGLGGRGFGRPPGGFGGGDPGGDDGTPGGGTAPTNTTPSTHI
jgi:hypothetical protein